MSKMEAVVEPTQERNYLEGLFLPDAEEHLNLQFRGDERERFQKVKDRAVGNWERLRKGSFDLSWIHPPKEHLGAKARPSARGLTWTDINKDPRYGTIPSKASNLGFAPRGAYVSEEEEKLLPSMGYDVLNDHDVWADNVISLYEEAKSRQWNATSDIPWGNLKPLSEEIEIATSQLCTFLTQVEFVAGDFPSRWIWRIPNDFFEVKSFMSTQIVDEARHTEVFRKRALANGGGLLKVAAATEWGLKTLLDAPDHTRGTFLLNTLGEGFVLTIFRAGEYLSMTDTDKEIFRRCMQDEARHVSYGVMQAKYFLEHHPNRKEAEDELNTYMDYAESVLLPALLFDPTVLEPFVMLFSGSVAKMDEGMDAFRGFWGMFLEEYFQRCDRAGLNRRELCKLPRELPF